MTITFTERYTNKNDRSDWGRGPWNNEPEDKLVWKDEATGLDCMMLRNGAGAWCGYVGVPETHDMHGVEYYHSSQIMWLEAHGGITYSAGCADHICHLGDEDGGHVWWFGFDCAHSTDRTPSPMWGGSYGVYRTKEYVIGEIQQLALDLVDMKREDDDDDDSEDDCAVADAIVSML